MTTKIPTQYEYEKRERKLHQTFLDGLQKYTLNEKRETREAFIILLQDTPYLRHIAELVASGCYGQGAKMAYERIQACSARSNKSAMFSHLIGALEKHVTLSNSIKAYKSLTDVQQVGATSTLNQVLVKYKDCLEVEPKKYTLSDIKYYNEKNGYFFFSKKTMKHWGCKVLPTIYHREHKVYFVLSNKNYNDTAKVFRVCEFFPTSGNVKYANKTEYSCKEYAREGAKAME